MYYSLILVVLVQTPKGGGISSTFRQLTKFMGARRGTDFIENYLTLSNFIIGI
jgi:protein translocase SecG subunit